jgi:hypothetical protein
MLVETLQRVFALQFLELDGCVLVQELVDREVSATDTDVDLVFLDLDGDALGTELVDAVALPHESSLTES